MLHSPEDARTRPAGEPSGYTCPMHPEVRSDHPGTCPKCGMTLVPVAENAVPAHAGAAHHAHMHPVGRSPDHMSWWERFRLSMTMTMGMEHSGLAGREMARLMEEDIRRKFFFALILSVPIIAYSPVGANVLGLHPPTPLPAAWILFILTTPVYFYSGWIFLYSSVKALQARTLNMSVLIAVGITAAYGFSVVLTLLGSSDSYYEAAALLITFVLFGHWMEMRSRRGTTDALQALFALVPPQARMIWDGQEQIIPTSAVKVGDVLVLKPGDKVPVDGEIIQGETAIDEALVTGESLPVPKRVGDRVIGGSINQTGSVQFRATKVGADTALAQIVRLVETAQNSKAPGQRLADRFATYLVIVAVGGGLLTFVVWFLLLGQPLIVAMTFAISTVVIACPDALGLATPTAVAVGTALGARHNILIKDATTLEQVSKIQVLVLDKTGTLTEGKPTVTDVFTASGFDPNRALQLIGAAEAESAHPLSSAILAELKARGLVLPDSVEHFVNLSGLGVKAIVEGHQVYVGTVRLMRQEGIDLTPLQRFIDQLLAQGQTLMILAVDSKAVGVVGAADPVKPTARQTIERLKQLGIEVAMITGDNLATAQAVAQQLGIQRVFAEVLPQDKADYIQRLQQEGTFVAMVGDGVNDAPALARADIGIAIGAGTDVAIETAKVVLMKSDPADIVRAIKLSKATVVKMKQNLFWASIYNLLAIPIAAGILYPSFGISLRPEVSALLMSASSIIVATNAVLLNRAERDLVNAE
jgi:P-type Cu2+ transporter